MFLNVGGVIMNDEEKKVTEDSNIEFHEKKELS